MKENKNDIHFGSVVFSAKRPYIIAEAGVNHENDFEEAVRLVEEAAKAGADAIKFQSYRAETLASQNSPSYWDLSKEPTTSQYQLFKKFDKFTIDDYRKLAEVAKKNNIVFLSTPFDFQYADDLADLMPFYKISSSDLTNTPFIKHCAGKGKPMIISVGAANMEEVVTAVEVVKGVSDQPIALLHCVLSYPTDPKNANLRFILNLKEAFPDLIIGYSDHVPPHYSCLALNVSWLLGARVIEKHFTLDKTKEGNDHYHAMDTDDLRAFREQGRFIENTLGDYEKRVLACEIVSRKQARRSLVATKRIKAGVPIKREDITFKRPGHGISPTELESIIGKVATRDISEDDILIWDMFIKI